MSRKRNIGLIILTTIIVLFALTGCADVTHVEQCVTKNESTYGFWGGTWHGIIMVPSFIGSLIWDDVAVYAINNNGAWYDFGFVGGFFTILKLIGFGRKKMNEK
jgi:hypothetical protein